MKYLNTASRNAVCAAIGVSIAGVVAVVPSQAFAQSSQSAADESQGVEEIIVTAQRREEKLQNVPISVTAITASAMERTGVTGTLQLNQVVPSVQFTGSGPQAIFYIRGVGNSSAGIGEEGANAVYIDGVYVGDLSSVNMDFNNIARLEVLKGPQGTLFGRNSSGGLINIITRDPGDKVVVKASVGYANYKKFQGQFYLAAPLTEKISADIAFTGRDQSKGWGKNLFTGKDFYKGWRYGLRSKVVFRPGDATKITWAGAYTQQSDTFNTPFTVLRGTTGFFGFPYAGDYNINSSTPGFSKQKGWDTSLTIEHDLGWATLTSVSALHDIKTDSALDSDYVPLPLVYVPVVSETKTAQQELRLASNGSSRLSWQLGMFYYHANADLKHQIVQGQLIALVPFTGKLGQGFDIQTGMKTNSIAVFGEVTYALTDTTHVTAGLRYTHDKRSYRGRQVAFNQPPGSLAEAVFTKPLQTDSKSFSKATYRIAIRQDLTDKINIYASYNRGFKSGIYSLNAAPGTNPILKPQTIDAFEVGVKSQLFDNMLRLNVAGFHYKIKNYQVRTASPALGAQALLLNAAEVKVDGVEAEFELAPTRALRINGNATYVKSRFVNFPNNFTYIPKKAFPFGSTLVFQSANGNRTPQSPRFAASLGASYTMDVGDHGRVTANVLYSYTGKVYFESDNRIAQPELSIVNASLEYRPSPSWGIEVWGKNLTDRHAYVSVTTGATGDQGQLSAPRTYGVNVKFDF